MSMFDSYPAIINVLEVLLCADDVPVANGIAWDRVAVPDNWLERFNTAEVAADSLTELSVDDVVPDDQLDTETVSREMGAIAALAEDGEVKDLVYLNTENGLILKEILEACIEGDLRPLVQAQLEDEIDVIDEEDEDEDDEETGEAEDDEDEDEDEDEEMY